MTYEQVINMADAQLERARFRLSSSDAAEAAMLYFFASVPFAVRKDLLELRIGNVAEDEMHTYRQFEYRGETYDIPLKLIEALKLHWKLKKDGTSPEDFLISSRHRSSYYPNYITPLNRRRGWPTTRELRIIAQERHGQRQPNEAAPPMEHADPVTQRIETLHDKITTAIEEAEVTDITVAEVLGVLEHVKTSYFMRAEAENDE